MTKREILEIALRQSALDCGCSPEDFQKRGYTLAASRPDPRARRYLSLPFSLNLVSYGAGVVASVSPDLRETAEAYLKSEPVERWHALFETPRLLRLGEALRPFGQSICFMAEYFLPEPELLRPLTCPFPLRLLGPEDFRGLYLPQWSNALCAKRAELDVLGVGAYDGGELVGFAACSADCEEMWQIGVDVLPAYRRQGIAAAMVSRLALEILERGKVPFYCAAWSNLPSVRTAVRSGFRPAWVELTAKPDAAVREMLDG